VHHAQRVALGDHLETSVPKVNDLNKRKKGRNYKKQGMRCQKKGRK
jgi:hypothetical protein